MGGTGSRYTFEAMFAGINASSKRVPYDGSPHQLVGISELFKGTVGETERFRSQLAKLEENGGYRLDPVKYQLIDENGNPVGEPTTSFQRTLPGKYKVRVYSTGTFAGVNFKIYKDVTLEIYAAKVIVKKYWINDHYSTRPDDLDVDVKRYDTKNKGVINNPDTNVNNRNRAKSQAVKVTASQLSGYQKEEPAWEKHGNVWIKEYNDVLVRNVGYSETDQGSGYDLFFADETVPEGYQKTVENWVRSDKQDGTDYLTTTITFRNEYLEEPINIDAMKQWVGDSVQTKHPSVTFFLMRSVNGAPFEKVDGSEKVIPANATGDSLTVHWTGVPQKNEQGTEHYTYKIGEMTLDGFTTEINGSVKEGYTVKNTDGRIDLPVLKVNKNDTSKTLQGAEFVLYKMKNGTPQRYTAQVFPESPYSTVDDCRFVSGQNGKITIEGLSDGTYQLEEKKAPAGYVTNGEVITFTVSDGIVTLTDGAEIATYEKANLTDGEKTLVIKNEPGKPLPSTGGQGTTWMYILGMLLTVVAGGALVVRRRMRSGC